MSERSHLVITTVTGQRVDIGEATVWITKKAKLHSNGQNEYLLNIQAPRSIQIDRTKEFGLFSETRDEFLKRLNEQQTLRKDDNEQ